VDDVLQSLPELRLLRVPPIAGALNPPSTFLDRGTQFLPERPFQEEEVWLQNQCIRPPIVTASHRLVFTGQNNVKNHRIERVVPVMIVDVPVGRLTVNFDIPDVADTVEFQNRSRDVGSGRSPDEPRPKNTNPTVFSRDRIVETRGKMLPEKQNFILGEGVIGVLQQGE
jgi:hypothetical protein